MANITKITNITELKTRKGRSGAQVELQGYYTLQDSGGGRFYWDNTSILPDNKGTIIQVVGVTIGRWIREYSGYGNVKFFGTIEDGITDDSIRIQLALDNMESIEFNEKSYLTTTTINIPTSKNIRFNNSIIINNSFTDVNTATSLNNYLLEINNSNDINFSGNLYLKSNNGGLNCVTNGLKINNSENIYLNGTINLINLNFGLGLLNVNNSFINIINGKNINGYQLSLGLGGDLMFFVNCNNIKINTVKGIDIQKAGVYFSLDANLGYNKNISIVTVDMILNLSTVSSAVALRNIDGLYINSINSINGVSGLYCSYDSVSGYINNININSITVIDNTSVTDNSYAVYLTSITSINGNNKAKNFYIGNIFNDNSNKGSLIIDKCENVNINQLISLNSSQSSIRIIGSNNINITETIVDSLSNNGILMDSELSNNIDFINIKLNNVLTPYYGVRIDNNMLKNGSFNNIYLSNCTTDYAIYYATMSSVSNSLSNISINNVDYLCFINVYICSFVKNGEMFLSSILSHLLTVGFNGDIVKNSNLTLGNNIGWICTSTGNLGTWNQFGVIV